MATIRTLEIAFEKQIKNILQDFMSRIDYSNFSDSFDEGLFYFNDIARQPVERAVNTVHKSGYKDANKLIKNRMKTAAVIESISLLYIVKKLTDRLQDITENHKEEITAKLVQHQTEQFTYDQIVDDMLTFFEYDTVSASRFARTATNYVYNQAHLQRYRDVGFIPGVKYAAHIDVVTSKICRMLNKTIWAVDDPDILTPPNHFNCLVAGTKIITKDGEKDIEDIKIGEMVLTHKLNYKPVTERMIFKAGHVLNIITKNHEISITKDHPIYIYFGGHKLWVKAGILQNHIHEIITISNGTHSTEQITNIDTKKADVVYNLSVLDDESYVANGIIVHNCRSRILPYYGGIPGERDYTKDFDKEFIEEANNTLKTFKEKYWKM